MAAALVFLSFVPRDSEFRERLEAHLAPLQRQGLLEVWGEHLLPPGEPLTTAEQNLDRARVIVLLLSADFLADAHTSRQMEQALQRRERGSVLVMPVLLRPVALHGTPLQQLQILPRNGVAISSWPSQDAAWLDVVAGLRNAVSYGAPAALPASAEGALAPVVSPGMPIDRIFTTRQPELTYVEPSQMPYLRAYLRLFGPGLVVEGPSGIGKTTAVNRACEELGIQQRKIIATIPEHLAQLDTLLTHGFTGHLVVDDFHRLDDARKRGLANRIKAIVDLGQEAKITLIGINPVGESLTDGFPDVAGRFEVVRLGKQTDEKVAEMIGKGERAANLRFLRRDEFINASMGSFFTAQRLCAKAAQVAGVFSVPAEFTEIAQGPADVVRDLLDTSLRTKYHAALLELCACDPSTPPSGATLALLWLLTEKLTQQKDGHVSLEEARYRYPHLAPALSWLGQSNLMACFGRYPALRSLFFYNRGARMLSIEDPQLEFYLRNLSFPELARSSGHLAVREDPEQGLIIP